MPMNPNFLCCIGAELKNSTQQTTRMSQVYLYRSFENDTLSDMLSAGFFNAAMGIIRQDDLLLLYSPNETIAKYAYARVSSVSSSGVVIKQIGIDATGISVDTTGYSNLSGNNLQEILNNLDTIITTINNAFVRKDGSSVMTGPLKFRAGSFVGAIAGGLGDGISIYKLKSDDSIDSEVASLTKENGFTPGTTNAQDIGSSSLKWKDLYIARVITAVLNNGADINVPTTGGTLGLNDFSNITDSAKNIGNWSSNVANCITEIPQDIKLELDNGTLTLKAGSKVYVPNGAGVFDVLTTASDTTVTNTNNGVRFIYANSSSGAVVVGEPLSNTCSGTTDSLSGVAYHTWYDTTNNVVNRYGADGTTVAATYSFPIATVTISGGAISSIDQVFNGFGYIGSTMFALPGVKGLVPNGRNADGTLNNTAITVSSVFTNTVSGSHTGLGIRLSSSSIGYGDLVYDERTNFNYLDSALTTKRFYAVVGTADTVSGTITRFTTDYAFRALDYNDTKFIAHQATPSNRYIELTLPASNQNIIAPGDGYVTLVREAAQSLSYISLQNSANGLRATSTASNTGTYFGVSIHVSMNDPVLCQYTSNDTTVRFRFVYANGAK